MPSVKYTRRTFLSFATAGLSVTALLPGCGDPSETWQFFSREEARLVTAMAERIVPADEFPGAAEAGVTRFIDRQLVGPYKRHQPWYRSGLDRIQRTCRERHAQGFEALSPERQTDFLQSLETSKEGAAGPADPSPSEFFGMVRSHCLQGFYGDPKHGGNRDWVGYHMLDLRVIEFDT